MKVFTQDDYVRAMAEERFAIRTGLFKEQQGEEGDSLTLEEVHALANAEGGKRRTKKIGEQG